MRHGSVRALALDDDLETVGARHHRTRADGELTGRYGDHAGYLAAFTESLDAAIDARFVLPEDREALLGQAAAVAFPLEGGSA